MSKGSAPRPFSVSNEEYAKRWDEIFRKEPPKEPERPPQCAHPFCACETDCKSPGNDR